MAYVAVRGGEKAIEASLLLSQAQGLGNGTELQIAAIEQRMSALIDIVMSEASLYDKELAALAIKQAQGSPEEAVFLLRAFRSTVPRLFTTRVVEPETMRIRRRISASFKDIPGGQILGPSPDYSHRLLDFDLIFETPTQLKERIDQIAKELKSFAEASKFEQTLKPDADYPKENQLSQPQELAPENSSIKMHKDLCSGFPKVADYLRKLGFLETIPIDNKPPRDITKEAFTVPTERSQRLQILTRGQTGAVISFGYANLRGFGGGALHPTVGELRVGDLPLTLPNPLTQETDNPEQDYYLGEIRITEVETLVPRTNSKGQIDFDLGYGACYGQNETKAIAMSILDANLESNEQKHPTQDEEFILYHLDSLEATGFISHLKLPHYVTFQAKLNTFRQLRKGSTHG
jgi:alpha-D-ribose 1-methylphosphonate 5-triphosphate synthase subunit PhnI